MSRITRVDVERMSELARLSLSEEEIIALTRDMDQILDHVDQLGALDTSGIEPTAHAMELQTPTRPDEAAAPLDPELALSNAPLREGTAFVVPKVLEGEGS